MKYKLISKAVLCFGLLLMACSREDPYDMECLIDTEYSTVRIHLDVNASLNPYRTITDPTNDDASSTRSDDSWQLKYVVAAYPVSGNSTKPFAMIKSGGPDIEMNLPLGKYHILAWSDYTPSLSLNDYYFHTDDFTDFLLKEKYSYNGVDAHKIGFLGAEDVTVTSRIDDVSISLSSAMGQYRINAVDSPDYTVGKVIVSYPDGLPSSLNGITGRICHKWYGVSFETNPSDSNIFDNVFSENSEIKVPVKIEVYDINGKLRARRNTIDIPLVRGGRTYVNAKVYTLLDPDSDDVVMGDGAGIDGEYDDTFIIDFTH